MSFKISFQALADVLGTNFKQRVPQNSDEVVALGISTDTRLLKPHEIFLALRGEQFDGHHFLHQAMERGAIAVLVEESTDVEPCFLVQDTLLAYQAIARWWRQILNIPIVAITGSVGKTTTKELIAATLSTQGGAVLKTQANYNNQIGVPKTLLELNESHQFGVIEMGMRGRGQISLLADIARPNVGVITNVGTAHIELLGSEQAIAEAKCELLAGLDPGGIAVLNHDNERLMRTAQTVWSGSQITFGLAGGDIQGKLLDADHIEVNGVTLPLPLPGKHNAMNFLAAIAVMEAFSLNWTDLRQGLALDLPGGRAARWRTEDDILLLDETYNAGLESMKAALQLLQETPGRRRIAVLGTMKELGEHSVRLHREVGLCVSELQLDYLLTLADPAEQEALMDGATPVPTAAFTSHAELVMHLKTFLEPGDRVLFKASRAVALDKVVNELKQILSAPA